MCENRKVKKMLKHVREFCLLVLVAFALSVSGCGKSEEQPAAPGKPAQPAAAQPKPTQPQQGTAVSRSGTAQPAKKAPAAGTQPKRTPPRAPRQPLKKVPLDDNAKLLEKKRAELNNTAWDIDVVRMADKERVRTPDRLVFFDKKVYSEKFQAKGYKASNYSMRIQPDGSVIWETMQTKEGEGQLFLRGNLRKDLMDGMMVKHPVKGKNEDFAFVSTAHNKITAPPAQRK